MKRIITALRLKEISAVDNPAQEGARAVIMKRATDQPGRAHLRGLAEKALSIARKADGARTFNQVYAHREDEERRWEAQEELWAAFSALQESVSSVVADGTLATNEQLRRIDESLDQFYSAVADKLPGIAEDLAKVHLSAAFAIKEHDMDPKEIEALKAKAAEADEANAKAEAAEKRAERAEALAKLAPDARKYFDSLEGDEAEAFLAKSADDQAEVIRKAADADETIEINGRVIRKAAVGEDVFEAMKAQKADNDAARAELAKSREENENSRFTKMAESAEFANLPGETADKAKSLRAIHAIKDEGERNTALEMLKAGNSQMTKSLRVVGADGEPEGGAADLVKSAEAKLTEKAEEIRKAEPTLTKEQAFDRATQENPKLYADYSAAFTKRAKAADAA